MMEGTSPALEIFNKIFEVVDEWDEECDQKETCDKGKIVQVVWSNGDFTSKTTRVRIAPDAPKRPRCYKVYNDLKVLPLDFSSL